MNSSSRWGTEKSAWGCQFGHGSWQTFGRVNKSQIQFKLHTFFQTFSFVTGFISFFSGAVGGCSDYKVCNSAGSSGGAVKNDLSSSIVKTFVSVVNLSLQLLFSFQFLIHFIIVVALPLTYTRIVKNWIWIFKNIFYLKKIAIEFHNF